MNDTTAGIPAVIKEDSVYYIREPGGSLITRVSSSNTSYYHFDQLGSTRLITDGSGNVTDEYAYDAYGSLLSHNRRANSVNQPYQYVGRLGYYTCWQEPEFELLQLGVRFNDAEVGGFTSRDPWTWSVGDERVLATPERERSVILMGLRHPILYNRTIYCSSNPTVNTDETGKGKWKCKNQKPPCWIGQYGKRFWCRGCSVSCQRYCNEEFNDKPGKEWEKCSAACAVAEVQCELGKGYNFIAVW